jgi:hypothetical protein
MKPSKKNSAVQISHPEKAFGRKKDTRRAIWQISIASLSLASALLPRKNSNDGALPRRNEGRVFLSKEMPKGMPPGTPTKRLPNKGGSRAFTNYVLGGSLETQMALVNFGAFQFM